MSILVIIDRVKEPINDVLINILRIYANGSETNLQIVNLSDRRIADDIWNSHTNVTCINGFDIYVNLENNFHSFLTEWLTTLLKHKPNFPFIEYSRLSEQNFSLTLFQDLRQLHLIDHLLSQQTPERVVYVSDRDIYKCVNELCTRYSTQVTIHPRPHMYNRLRQTISPFGRTLLLFLHNFFSEIGTIIFVKLSNIILSRVEPSNRTIGIYAIYPSNWTFDSTEPNYRYIYNLFSHINHRRNGYYLISILRQNSDALLKLRQSLRSYRKLISSTDSFAFTVLENHGSLGKLFSTYLSIQNIRVWFRQWNEVENLGLLNCFSISISPLLSRIRLSIFREIPKNMYTELCSHNAAIAFSPKLIYAPIYELLEGRSITSGHHLNNTKVIGVQHGIMFNLQTERVISSLALLDNYGYSKFVPDIISVEGENTKQAHADHRDLYAKVKVIGAPRIILGNKCPILGFDGDREARTSIIIFDDRYSSIMLTELATSLANAYSIIFRPHPSAANLRLTNKLTDRKDQGWFLETSTSSMTDLIVKYKPTAGICCLSGVYVELLKLGIPVILMKNNRYPITSPLFDGRSVIPLFSSYQGVQTEITLLKNSPDYHKQRVISGLELFKQLVKSTGDEATKALSMLITH